MVFRLNIDTSKKLFYLVAALLGVIMIFFLISDLIIMSLLVVFSLGVSYFVYFTKMKSIGLELATFVIVITGFAFGSTWGAILGLFLMSFHIFVSQYVGPYILWVIPEYIILGYIAGTTGLDIITFGIYSVLMISIFNLVITFITYRSNLGKYSFFLITNVIFNFLLFTFFGKIVLNSLI